MTFFRAASLAILLSCPAALSAQGTNITLGAINADPKAPVEMTADSLSVDQSTGKAVFSGNVKIGQGDLRMSAGEVKVVYSESSGQITNLDATGGVTFVTPTEAAEAQSAVYDLTSGMLVMTGNVLLTQGQSTIASDKMTVNLKDGTARMEGGVRTIFNQGKN